MNKERTDMTASPGEPLDLEPAEKRAEAVLHTMGANARFLSLVMSQADVGPLLSECRRLRDERDKLRDELLVQSEVHFLITRQDGDEGDEILCSCGCGWPCTYDTSLRAVLGNAPELRLMDMTSEAFSKLTPEKKREFLEFLYTPARADSGEGK